MNRYLRVSVWSMLIPYWIGLFSGWFAEHYGKMSNTNPDTYIHAALFFLTGPMLVDLWSHVAKRAEDKRGE